MRVKRLVVVLLHVGYWLVYLGFVLLLLLAAWLQVRYVKHLTYWGLVRSWPGWIMVTIPQAITFYVFYSVLFPRFLKTKRLFSLAAWGVGVMALSSLLGLIIDGWFFNWRYGPHFTLDTVMEIAIISVICCIDGVLALVIKGFISWYEEIHLKESLHRKNYEMELALLKSQLNPHFLFNTLNNIDVLIRMDADRASMYLNQLSDILRFMLYETRSEQISIRQELQYIDKYIQLQKIRTAHPEYIHYEVQGDAGERLVEPMLFIPFIENAFKHAEKKVEDAIRVRFTFEEARIVFMCENRYLKAPVKGEGLGDELIRRRLALLYPGRHRLDIDIQDNTYRATLEIRYAN